MRKRRGFDNLDTLSPGKWAVQLWNGQARQWDWGEIKVRSKNGNSDRVQGNRSLIALRGVTGPPTRKRE